MLISLTISVALLAQQSVADLDAEFKEKTLQFQQDMEQMFETGEFKEIVDPISIYYPKFRELAKNNSIEKSERCMAQLWCMRNFSGKVWGNPNEVFDSLASLFVKEFSNDSAAEEMPEIIRNVTTVDKKQRNMILKTLRITTKSEKVKARCFATTALIELDNNNFEGATNAANQFLEQYAGTEYAYLVEPISIQGKLQIGKQAPTLTGEDVHGNQLSLESALGKVTYVVFWGFW